MTPEVAPETGSGFSAEKARAAAWFRFLRDEIVAAFEGLETRHGGPQAGRRFDQRTGHRHRTEADDDVRLRGLGGVGEVGLAAREAHMAPAVAVQRLHEHIGGELEVRELEHVADGDVHGREGRHGGR